MRWMMLVLAVSLSCEGEEQQPVAEEVTVGAEETTPELPTPQPPPILSGDVSEVVLAQSMFEGWTVVPLAQLEREDRVVVVVWPAIDPSGEVVDDDLIGLTLQRVESGLQVVESNWGMRTGRIVEHLGGEPASRERGEGVPADQLATQLHALPVQFVERVRAGDRAGAVEVAIAFSRLWAFEFAVESDTASELLAGHTQNARIEATLVEGEEGRVRARFFQGQDMVEEELLIATQHAPNRWVFTDHERISAGVR